MLLASTEAAHRQRHRVRGVPGGGQHRLLALVHQEPLPPHLHRRQVQSKDEAQAAEIRGVFGYICEVH